MYDEQQTLADRIDKAMLEVNDSALSILYKSDGGGSSVIHSFSDDSLLFHALSNYMGYLNNKTNEFTDGVYNVLQTNSTNKGGLTSYGLRVNGVNPLFGIPHDYSGNSTASKLVGLMNTFQSNKVNLLTDVVNNVYNHNVEVVKNLITVILNREVLGVKLGSYSKVSKIQKKITTKRIVGDVGIAGTTVVAGKVISNKIGSSAAKKGAETVVKGAVEGAAKEAAEKVVEEVTLDLVDDAGNVILKNYGKAAVTEAATTAASSAASSAAAGTELMVVGAETTAVSTEVVAATELATTSVGTSAGGTAVGSAAGGGATATGGSLFASVAAVVVPALIGTAIITGGLTVAVIIETRKKLKRFADAVDSYYNLMVEYVNSFYCNSVSYPTLVYDDSNPEGPTVFRSDAVTTTSSQLASSILDLNVERAVGLLAGYLSYDTNLYNKVNRFLRDGEGLVTYDDVISCINRIHDNIRTVVKQFTLAEREISTDVNSINVNVPDNPLVNKDDGNKKIDVTTNNNQSNNNKFQTDKFFIGTGATIATGTTSGVASVMPPTTQYRVQDTNDIVGLATDRKEYLEKLEKAQKEAEAKLAKLKEQQQKELEKLKKQQDEKIKKLKEQQAKELEKLREQQKQQALSDAQKQEAIEKLKQEQAKELEKLRQEQAKEAERLKQEQASELEKMKQNAANEISKIKQNNKVISSSNINHGGGSSAIISDPTTESTDVTDNIFETDNSETVLDTTEKPSYTTTKPNKVVQTNDKSGNVGVVGAVLGIGALGAAGVVGARYIKKKKENETYSDDENYYSNNEEFSEVEENKVERSSSKYKAGSVNGLQLDDISDINTTNSNITNSETLDF